MVVTIEVPTGSTFDGTSAMGDFRAEGELGACTVKTAMGDIRLDHTGALQAKTSFGNVTVDRVVGDAEVTTSSGDIRLGEIDGAAVVKNSNGDTEIDRVAGDVRVKASNGDVLIGHGRSRPSTPTANGDVRVDEVGQAPGRGRDRGRRARGRHPPRAAAWLDVSTSFGSVRNSLDSADGPRPSEGTVEVRARRPFGDIVIDRSSRRRVDSGEGEGPTMSAASERLRPRDPTAGMRKSYGDKVVLDGVDLSVARGDRVRAARPERRRQDDDGAHPVDADPRRRRRGRASAATTWPREPDAVRAVIGVTGQFSAVDNLLTGEENLHADGRAAPPGSQRGRRRVAELLETLRPGRRRGDDAARRTRAACGGGSTWP